MLDENTPKQGNKIFLENLILNRLRDKGLHQKKQRWEEAKYSICINPLTENQSSSGTVATQFLSQWANMQFNKTI